MNGQKNKSLLEKFLSIFTDVRAGEGVNAVILFLSLFLLLSAYYIIKPVREALILSGGGAEVKSYASVGQLIIFLFAVPFYSKLASILPRRRLITMVTIFFVGCLGVFYVLARMEFSHFYLGIIFYLWVGIFNLMVIAQFWSFSNDLYTPESGKRIFVIIAFGASSGAVFGSFLTGRLIRQLGVYDLLLIAGGILIVSLLLTMIVDSRSKRGVEVQNRINEVDQPLEKGDAFRLVFRNRYLLYMAFLMLFLNWVNTTGEYILGQTITESAIQVVGSGTTGGLSDKQFIGKFYADFFFIVNLASFLMQLFLVSRILKYVGVRAALLVLPIIALSGYFIIAFIPVLSIIRWVKTAENATDYSLQNTVRQVLFLPTTREEKYKAKQAIDTFFVRTGDVLQAVLVYVGLHHLNFQTKHFALFNIALVMVWLILAFRVGRMNQKLLGGNPDAG